MTHETNLKAAAAAHALRLAADERAGQAGDDVVCRWLRTLAVAYESGDRMVQATSRSNLVCRQFHLQYVEMLKAERDAARAALAVEKKTCDALRAACPPITRDGQGVTLWAGTVNHHRLVQVAEELDERRAAAAKALLLKGAEGFDAAAALPPGTIVDRRSQTSPFAFGKCGLTGCRAVSGQVNHGYCHSCRRTVEAKKPPPPPPPPPAVWG